VELISPTCALYGYLGASGTDRKSFPEIDQSCCVALESPKLEITFQLLLSVVHFGSFFCTILRGLWFAFKILV